MTVNFDKSVILTFFFLKSAPVFNPPIPSASHVTEIKLLGVHITSDLKWNKHVDGMLKKANLAIRSLKLLARHGIPAPHLLRIYFSFIRSTLEYCCPVWHFGLTREQSDRVERVQYRALLVISKAPKIPYISLLNQFQLQTLQSRRLN